MRILAVVLMALLGGALAWGAQGLPPRGDPGSPASSHEGVSVHYIENAYAESRTPNMVTAVLADYRGFDTFGEAVVVVTAAVACLLILLRSGAPAGGASTGAGGVTPGRRKEPS
jgi:multicomponent Na+:H+ antiporter subunit B